MTRIFFTATAAAAAVWISGAAAALSDSDCDCYRTSANDVFTDYTLSDFRRVGSPKAVPELQSTLPDSAFRSTPDADTGVLQDGFISGPKWNQSWTIQEWGRPKANDTLYPMSNSFSNVFIDRNKDGDKKAKTKLVLRTRRFEGFQSAAEVEHQQKNLLYASARFRARVIGDAGAVAGLFYYQNGNNESDIEILTRDDPTIIRYSNQPTVDDDGNQIPDSSTIFNLATKQRRDDIEDKKKRSFLSPRADGDLAWTEWHTHRIDWIAGKSSWYVDGEFELEKTYGVPTVPSYIVLNMWGDGGVWSGEMEVNAEARLEIEWIEMAFNTSGPVEGVPDEEDNARRKSKRADACTKMCTLGDGAPHQSGAVGLRRTDSRLAIAVAIGAMVLFVAF